MSTRFVTAQDQRDQAWREYVAWVNQLHGMLPKKNSVGFIRREPCSHEFHEEVVGDVASRGWRVHLGGVTPRPAGEDRPGPGEWVCPEIECDHCPCPVPPGFSSAALPEPACDDEQEGWPGQRDQFQVDEHSVPEGFAASTARTVRDRGNDYGHPQHNHQLTADLWSAWLSRRLGERIELSPEDVCMLNVLQKQSRLAFGTKDDSWQDVVGYAENVAMLAEWQRNV